MKYILLFAAISCVVSCCPKINTAKKLNALTTVNNDSVENLRHMYLKGLQPASAFMLFLKTVQVELWI